MSRKRPPLFRSSLLTALALVTASPSRADEPADLKVRAKDSQAYAKQETEAVRFRFEEGGPPIVLHPEPILKWSNPIVGTVSGGLYVWTAQGRPEVVASVFLWYARPRPLLNSRRDELTDEFLSLSLGTLEMERDGQPVWTSSRPGVELSLLQDAPAPAGGAAQRLRQMRDLARRFTGNQSQVRGVQREVRLLPQPVYRYEGTVGDLIDGALFVFVDATDPQVVLAIEARQVEGLPRWHYALGRMTHEQLRVSDRGHEVWNVPLLSPAGMTDRRATYTQFFFDLGEAAETPAGR